MIDMSVKDKNPPQTNGKGRVIAEVGGVTLEEAQ